jgi:glucose-6-phosphate 1-epimerase
MAAAQTIAELDKRFGIPGAARVLEGNGGLAKVSVSSAGIAGEMYLLGAGVTAWKPAGAEEVLFVSAASKWTDSRAIRGGVPICFPWFGNKADDPKAPAHGFVRAKAWEIESVTRAEDAVTVSLFTGSDEGTKKMWPADFRLAHRATFGPELSMELEMTNTGAAPLRFEEALHTYFRIGDIARACVRGLAGIHYIDKTDGNREKTQQGDVEITAETDRVYLDTRGAVELEDAALRRRIRVSKENSMATVVWNPWVAKAKAMSDFGDEEWKQMVCVETCNVAKHAVTLRPGEKHRMKATVRVEGM